MSTDERNSTCAGCGMHLQKKTEYHPFAACLMFTACRNAETVRANLAAVVEHGVATRGKKR